MKYTVLDYFEETVSKYPDKIAFSDTNNSITFSELKKSGQVLASAIAINMPTIEVIAFYMEKSVYTIIGFVGSIYAGKPYTQINLKYPSKRIEEILGIIEPCIIITDTEHYEVAEAAFGTNHTIKLFEDLLNTNIEYKLLADRRAQMFDLQPLYINFTSGSTGVPKGVVVGHRSVIDFITCFTEIFQITDKDNIMNQAPFDFDVSVKDIYSALFVGATVHIIPTDFFIDPIKLIDFICDRKATILIWAVSALCFITSMNCLSYRIPDKLRIIMFSGEVMPIKHLNKLKKYMPEIKYVNLYGPTEITCNCTYHIVDREYSLGESLPIGVPFPNERIYIVDENNDLIFESGKKGELCVSGTALALGYYRDWSKTEDVFVQNPNNIAYYERLYKTGDIVEIREDGQIYYCSRKDSQIKHMGHRIELTEVELAIEAVEGVIRACCYYENVKDKIIAVYIGSVDESQILEVITQSLPYFMIPNVLFCFSSNNVPLNKNGKIDRKELYQAFIERGGKK